MEADYRIVQIVFQRKKSSSQNIVGWHWMWNICYPQTDAEHTEWMTLAVITHSQNCIASLTTLVPNALHRCYTTLCPCSISIYSQMATTNHVHLRKATAHEFMQALQQCMREREKKQFSRGFHSIYRICITMNMFARVNSKNINNKVKNKLNSNVYAIDSERSSRNSSTDTTLL